MTIVSVQNRERISLRSDMSRRCKTKSIFDIINNIPMGIFSTTLQGEMVFCSKRFAAILGYHSPIELLESRKTALPLNHKDDSVLYQILAEKGEVVNIPVTMIKKNGSPVLCAITAKTVSDKYGFNFLLDGLIKEIPKERKPTSNNDRDPIGFDVSLEGILIGMGLETARFLGVSIKNLINKPLNEFLPAEYHDFLDLSIGKIVNTGYQKVIIRIKNDQNNKQLVELSATLVKESGQKPYIHGTIQPLWPQSTPKVRSREILIDRFQGVLEMAGGVAHKLNQPLTIINHTLQDMLSSITESNRLYPKIVRLNRQIEHVNRLAQQVKNVKKYSVTEYIAETNIIDLDRAC
jgi:hypothetical protein